MVGIPIRAAILAFPVLFLPDPAVRAGEPEVAVPAHPPGATAAGPVYGAAVGCIVLQIPYNHLPILSR